MTVERQENSTKSPVIAIVAGEISGDILGAGLIKALKIQYPNARFIGIAGEKMLQEGCETLANMNELAVMGLFEVLRHLPRLLALRQKVMTTMLTLKPDIFIGIDAPDFNLDIELKLRQNGIKTVHYASPSVWAWRQKRVYKIAKAVDMMLAFLPFEKAFYDKFNVPCRFIGHTTADKIALKPSREEACSLLGLDPTKRYLAVLPGSRHAEINFLAPPFFQTAQRLQQIYPDVTVLVPAANAKCKMQIEAIIQQVTPDLNVSIFDGQARAVMIVAQATLITSGTATLEAMLCKSPMVVGYKMKPATYALAKRLVKTDFISLPNLLANEMLVPELIQQDCEVEKLLQEIKPYFSDEPSALLAKYKLQQRFTELHKIIQQDADQQAAQAVIELIETKNHTN